MEGSRGYVWYPLAEIGRDDARLFVAGRLPYHGKAGAG
jgi:hypothetical protein